MNWYFLGPDSVIKLADTFEESPDQGEFEITKVPRPISIPPEAQRKGHYVVRRITQRQDYWFYEGHWYAEPPGHTRRRITIDLLDRFGCPSLSRRELQILRLYRDTFDRPWREQQHLLDDPNYILWSYEFEREMQAMRREAQLRKPE